MRKDKEINGGKGRIGGRGSGGSRARRVAGVARLVLLAFCFTAVFATVLILGDGAFADTPFAPAIDSTLNIAEAGTIVTPKQVNGGNATGGTTPVAGKITDADIANSGFNPNSSGTWTITDSFDFAGAFTSANVSAYADFNGPVGVRYDDKLWSDDPSGGTQHQCYLECTDSRAAAKAALAVNYTVPSAIRNLIALSPIVKVEAELHSNVCHGSNMNQARLYVAAGSIDAKKVHSDSQKSGGGVQTPDSSSWSNSAGVSNSIEITSSVTTIGTGLDYGWKTNVKCTRNVKFVGWDIVFKISIDTNRKNSSNEVAAPSPNSNNFVPYRDSANVTGNNRWGVNYDYSMAGAIEANRDQLDTIGTNRTNLYSPQRAPLSTVMTDSVWTQFFAGSGNPLYYKKASLTFTSSGEAIDTLTISVKQNGTDKGTLGPVQLYNHYKFGQASSSDRSFKLGGDLDLSVWGVYPHVTMNNHYSVTIDLYMDHNATYTVTATDYSGQSASYVVDVRGIDLNAPKTNLSFEGTNVFPSGSAANTPSTDFATANNWASDKVSLTITEKDADTPYETYGNAPYVYYFLAYRANTIEKLNEITKQNPSALTNGWSGTGYYNDTAKMKPIGLKPAGQSFTFGYDFTTGKGTAIGGTDYTVDGFINGKGTAAKGTGYYRFDIYVFDLAGNNQTADSVKSFYVKVDTDQAPDYTASVQFNDVNTGAATTFRGADKLKWANNDAKLVIALGDCRSISGIKGNISGNTIVFTCSEDNKFTFSVYPDGTYWGNGTEDNTGGTKKYKYTIKDTTGADLTVWVYFDNSQKAIIFEYDTAKVGESYPEVDYETVITMYPGAGQLGVAAAESRTGSVGVPSEWGRSIMVRIDRNAPDNVSDVEDVYGTLQEFTIEYLLSNILKRAWYTGSYDSYTTTMQWLDEKYLNPTQYQVNTSDFVVYYAIARVVDQAGLTKLQNKQVENNYKKINESNAESYGLSLLRSFTATDFASMHTENLDLFADNGVGMRVIYFWTKDQAGNITDDIKVFYVLADNTAFNITTEVVENEYFGTDGISSFEANKTTAHRGDSVVLSLTFAQNYAPFGFYQGSSDDHAGDTLVFNNFSPFTDVMKWNPVDASLASYYTTTSVNRLNYNIDSDFLGPISSEDASVYFRASARRIISLKSWLSTTATYNGEAQWPVPELVEIEDAYGSGIAEAALDAINFLVKDNDTKNVLYLTSDGGTTTNVEEALVVDGVPVLFAPVNVGRYQVYIFTEKDDPNFVASWFTMDEDGNQVFTQNINGADSFGFEIQAAKLFVDPQEGTSVYGNKIVITYKVSTGENAETAVELTPEQLAAIVEKEGVNIEVALTANNLSSEQWQQYKDGTYRLNVGEYGYSVSGSATSGNYTISPVTDIATKYQITAREITIQTIAANKTYGDDDPSFTFGVPTADAFGWINDDGETGDLADIEKVLETIFPTADFGRYISNADQLYVYAAGSRISRAEGDDVKEGGYDFVVDGFNYNSNANFTIKITNEAKFTINQRSITLTVGQTVNVSYTETEPDVSSFEPTYKLSTADAKLQSAVDALLASHGLTLKKPGTSSDDPNKKLYKIWKYEIIFKDGDPNTYETTNIKFTLSTGDESLFIVNVASGTALLISIKNPSDPETIKKLTFVFGTNFDSETLTYKKLHELNILNIVRADGNEVDFTKFDDITWTVEYEGGEGFKNVGSYTVTISNGKRQKDGADLSDISPEDDGEVYVDNFTINVSAAAIVVKATIAKDNKTYGEPESEYGIGFEIQSINGQEITEQQRTNDEVVIANLKYSQVKALLNGSYARKLFTATGEVVSRGGQYDDATKEDGTVLNDESGRYYALDVDIAFTRDSANENYNNFTVSAADAKETKLKINRKQIKLETKKFRGVDKPYDGTSAVTFGNVLAYDLSDQFVGSDALTLVYNAIYWDYTKGSEAIGSPNNVTHPGIKFDGLKLEGAKAYNYVLYSVTNTSADDTHAVLMDDNVKKNRGEQAMFTLGDGTDKISVIIFYKNDEIDNPLQIEITMGSVGVYKNDFKITKVYDATTGIEKEYISLVQERQGVGGNVAISTAMKAGNYELIRDGATGTYLNSWVGEYYVNVHLLIKVENWTGFQYVDGLDVGASVVRGQEGIEVILENMPASITPYVLTAESFKSISFDARDYDATDHFTAKYEFAEGVRQGADTDEIIGLTLRAKSLAIEEGGEAKDVGTHKVTFMPTSDEEETFLSTITNRLGNYVLDADSLNSSTFATGDAAVTAEITPAKLVPNVSFVDRAYDGTSTIEVKKADDYDEYNLTVLSEYINPELLAELAQLKISGEPSYKLSANGAENVNVALDESGNAIEHNVLVSGLKVTASELFKNYVVYGSVYRDGVYEDNKLTFEGETVDDYELLGATLISKRPIPIVDNDVIIEDKVYDGQYTADVHINLPVDVDPDNPYIMPDDREYLTITSQGNYVRRNVGTNIAITLSDIRLVLTLTEDEIEAQVAAGTLDEATASRLSGLVNNYELGSYTNRRTGNILARPFILSAEVEGKVYDGSARISSRSIQYQYQGLLDEDRDAYHIQTRGGAYYIDKNVVLQKGGDGQSVADPSQEGKYLAADKQGAVYNPTLRNTASGVINYVIAYASDTLVDDDYIAYIDSNGDEPVVHYYETVPTEYDSAKLAKVQYVYRLPSTDKYVNVGGANYDTAKAAGAIVGFVEDDGIYLVDSDYAGAIDGTLANAMTFINVKGKIEQRPVTISSNSVYALPSATAFTKVYDGTTKFTGRLGTDFAYSSDSVSNVIKGDNITIGDLTASFNSADTSASYVEFFAHDIRNGGANNDRDNYWIDNTIVRISLPARITARPIISNLLDGQMVYGTPLTSVTGDVRYYLGSVADNNKLIFVDGAFYMLYTAYLAAVGLDQTQDAEYIKQLEELRYWKDSVSDTFSANPAGEYIKLGGNFGALPGVVASFGETVVRPNAGETSLQYILTGGTADNFSFEPLYTSAGTSTLTVVKKNLLVSTLDGQMYTMFYAGATPNVSISFYDVYANAYGLATGDSYDSVFVIDGIDYGPQVKWGIFDAKNNIWVVKELPKYYKTTADLEDGQYYVAYIAEPVDGAFDRIKNYTLHLGDIFAEAVDGGYAFKQNFSTVQWSEIGVTAFTSPIAYMEIVLPDIEGLSLSSTDYTFDYDATNHLTNLISGTLADDTVVLLGTYNGQPMDGGYSFVTDAGVYEGTLTLGRRVKIDDGDTNNYYYNLWSSEQSVRVTVNKISPQLAGRNENVEYAGRQININGRTVQYRQDIMPEIELNMFDIHIEKLVGESYEDVSEVVNAGTYRITFTLNEAFATANPNFNAESVSIQLTVSPAIIDVKIADDDYASETDVRGNLVLTASYDEEKSYDIDYTLEFANSLELDRDQLPTTDVNFFRDDVSSASDINAPGRYIFRIVFADDAKLAENYSFRGAEGILDLTASLVVNDNHDSIQLEEGIVANQLEVKQLYESGGTATDTQYWNTVDKYMPSIGQNAKLASVLRISLRYDNKLVDANGTKMTLSIKIPGDVRADLTDIVIYTTTRQGSLVKLTEYEVKDGYLIYETDYLGSLVFVDMAEEGLPGWVLAVIIVSGLVLAVLIVFAFFALLVRKGKLKKLLKKKNKKPALEAAAPTSASASAPASEPEHK